MSLVILSNTSLYEGDQIGPADGIDRAYSFSNQLQTPIVIPKNSEVALQSLKMNKDGTFQVGRSNSLFYQYIGEKLTDTFTYDLSTRHPAYTRIYPHGEVNADEFADSVEVAMNKAIYHPDLQGLATCNVKRNSSTSFDGYELKYDKAASASGTNTRPGENQLIKATSVSDGWNWDHTQHHFVKTSDSASVNARAFAQVSSAPLSCCQGNMEVTFNNCSNWSVGLSRYCDTDSRYVRPDGETVIRNFEIPAYFRHNGMGFFDYVARTEVNASNEYELKLYHSVWDGDTDELRMDEVKYYGYTGAVYSTPYNMTTNASGFTRCQFTLDGDQVDFSLAVGTGTPVKVCSPDIGSPALNSNFFKPICQSNQYLYGKFEIRRDVIDDDDAQNHFLKLDTYDARVLTGFIYNGIDTTLSSGLPLQDRLINFDWYTTLINLGTSGFRYLMDVDSRAYNVMDSEHVHTFVKTSGGKIKYAVVPILAQSDKYRPTLFANTEEVLGFNGASPMENPTSFNGSQLIFSSSKVPELISNQSVFVRLNGLTQRSTNGATGNQSNIIYHCPRFDNSGNQTGGLFFEPGEKTYIDINNATDIQVNNLGIDFVDKRERFMKSVVGSSVVVLHIRQKPKM